MCAPYDLEFPIFNEVSLARNDNCHFPICYGGTVFQFLLIQFSFVRGANKWTIQSLKLESKASSAGSIAVKKNLF